jgi:RNA polymerase sigma-70 factor, ECF subfamily
MAHSDQDLMARIRQRDEDAFEVLFERYRAAIQRHLAGIVRDEHAAGDLAQEVFLRVWSRAEQWDGRGEFRAWLFRIATNLALNHMRSIRRRREQPLEPPGDPASEETDSPLPAWMIDAAALGPDAAAELADRQRRLHRLVDGLPEEKREVFRLIHDAEMDTAEAAAALGIPEGTVRSRLHYARKRLAREWGEHEGVRG